MPVPGTQEIRKPLLEAFKGEAPHSFAISNFLEMMAGYFDLDLKEMSSGDKNIFRNRINEAKSDLRKYNLLSNPSKNTYMITRTGSEVLNENPDVISDEYLTQRSTRHLTPEETFSAAPVSEPAPEPEAEQEPIPEVEENEEEENEPELDEDTLEPEAQQEELHEEIDEEPDFSEQEFNDAPEEPVEPEPEQEPEELPEDFVMPSMGIEDVLAKYNSDLADEVLMKAAGIPSDKFEMLVIDLLSKMGYRAFQNARYTTETSGSDLIHGVILEDKMGLTPIYIHARKLSPGRTIGKADIQDFVEALRDKGGKGIFATTANFSEQAAITAADERIMLIDGQKLASLMVANNFCVNVEKVFELKAIDSESFSEYEV